MNGAPSTNGFLPSINETEDSPSMPTQINDGPSNTEAKRDRLPTNVLIVVVACVAASIILFTACKILLRKPSLSPQLTAAEQLDKMLKTFRNRATILTEALTVYGSTAQIDSNTNSKDKNCTYRSSNVEPAPKRSATLQRGSRNGKATLVWQLEMRNYVMATGRPSDHCTMPTFLEAVRPKLLQNAYVVSKDSLLVDVDLLIECPAGEKQATQCFREKKILRHCKMENLKIVNHVEVWMYSNTKGMQLVHRYQCASSEQKRRSWESFLVERFLCKDLTRTVLRFLGGF